MCRAALSQLARPDLFSVLGLRQRRLRLPGDNYHHDSRKVKPHAVATVMAGSDTPGTAMLMAGSTQAGIYEQLVRGVMGAAAVSALAAG